MSYIRIYNIFGLEVLHGHENKGLFGLDLEEVCNISSRAIEQIEGFRETNG